MQYFPLIGTSLQLPEIEHPSQSCHLVYQGDISLSARQRNEDLFNKMMKLAEWEEVEIVEPREDEPQIVL